MMNAADVGREEGGGFFFLRFLAVVIVVRCVESLGLAQRGRWPHLDLGIHDYASCDIMGWMIYAVYFLLERAPDTFS